MTSLHDAGCGVDAVIAASAALLLCDLLLRLRPIRPPMLPTLPLVGAGDRGVERLEAVLRAGANYLSAGKSLVVPTSTGAAILRTTDGATEQTVPRSVAMPYWRVAKALYRGRS